MKGLPFVVAPAEPTTRCCGTPASGILELPVLGGLTVAEAATISELLAEEQNSFVHGARLADAISKAADISISEAFGVIEKSIRGDELEPEANKLKLRYAEEIQEVARIYTQAGQRNMTATVTALIRHRLNMPQWSVEDTNGLRRPLFTAIWELAEDEQDAEMTEPAPPVDEETLGKPPEASGSARKPIGARSPGT